MPEALAGAGLEQLIAAATPALRFLAAADPTQRARTRVPLATWLERLTALGGDAVALPADARAELVALERTLRELEAGGEERSGDAAVRALAILDRLAGTAQAGRSAAQESGGRGEEDEVSAPGEAEPVAAASESEEVQARLALMAAPTTTVTGVGPARAAELREFGLCTVEDLLYHLPFRYDDRRTLRRASDLRPGDTATVALEIRRIEERRVGRAGRAVLSALAGDESGAVELVWYHQLRYFRSRLKPGSRWLVHGRIERGYELLLRIVHPELEGAVESESSPGAPRVVPVYEKPTAMPVSAMRRIVGAAVDEHARDLPDAVPPGVRRRLGLLPLAEAMRRVHRPDGDADAAALGAARSLAHRSIVFDELFFVQLGLLLRKASVAREPGIACDGPGDLVRRMIERLPFPLTGAQRTAIAEIEADQRVARPMHRLLQGDVGSGKTVVAVAAALRAIEAGRQAVFMAPTELLAEQHWETVRRVAGELGASLWYLTGETGAAERREVLARLAAGEPGLVVGTHALIQDQVRLTSLALAVIDEQHRFGVMQRAALSHGAGGASPDVLLMTATPIPRTLALSVYGDLDLSYLDELPPGRKPVVTRLLGASQRGRAYEVVRKEVAGGRQAYIVYPLIEESESSDLRDATSAAEELRREVFPDLSIALVHGRMPAAERDAIMRAFKSGQHQVLVATTVIEVGIDVPQASVIVIEHAERFGLAQLHQLRGRVGRGSDAAHCLLVADWAQSREARERLRVMTETRDGLRIAEADLAIRGPGALLGTRQAGVPDFRVANLLRDADVLRQARASAEAVLAADPTLSAPGSAALARVLDARWAGRLGLARVG